MSLEEAYRRDGYALIPTPLVPLHILEGALVGMEALRRGETDDGQPLAPEERAVILSSPTGVGDEESLCKLELPQLGSRGIRALVSLDSIGEQVARATGAEWVQVWWTQLLGKPPANGSAGGTNIGYHQDRNYWQGSWEEGSELLTCWVALSDVAEDGGPMQFIRVSSHRNGTAADCFAPSVRVLATDLLARARSFAHTGLAAVGAARGLWLLPTQRGGGHAIPGAAGRCVPRRRTAGRTLGASGRSPSAGRLQSARQLHAAWLRAEPL
jgi:hypothetical protein